MTSLHYVLYFVPGIQRTEAEMDAIVKPKIAELGCVFFFVDYRVVILSFMSWSFYVDVRIKLTISMVIGEEINCLLTFH